MLARATYSVFAIARYLVSSRSKTSDAGFTRPESAPAMPRAIAASSSTSRAFRFRIGLGIPLRWSCQCLPRSHSHRRRLQFLPHRDRMRHRGVQLVSVKLALPAADHDGGDAVADEVGERAAFAHELVDAEQ